MVGMYGLDGLHGLSGPQPVRKASASAPTANAERGDSIAISKEALTAAAASTKDADATPSVVEERIAAAKKSIEEGTYKLQHVVLQVAARIADVVDL